MNVCKTTILVLTCLCIVPVTIAQKGTAAPGFYPFGYNGDTWSGEVTAADDVKRELSLTYKRGDKSQTFVAFVPDNGAGWMKDEQGDRVIAIWAQDKKKDDKTAQKELPRLNLADFLGRHVTVYYIRREKKIDDQKVKFNEVIRIKFIKKD